MSNKQKDPNVKFTCQRCGTCCSLYCIPCTDKDLKRILNFLKFTPEDASDFLELVEPDEDVLDSYEDVPKVLVEDIDSDKLVLVLKSDANDEYCCFFEDNKCSIYPARPFVCRFFPFIYEYEEKKEIDLINNPRDIIFSKFDESTYCKGLNKGEKVDFDKLRETTVQTIKEDKDYEDKVNIWNLKVIFNQIKNYDEKDFLQYIMDFDD